MPAKLVAILGACRRRGRWEVSGVTKALVVLGHCHIDFREAYADPEVEKMKLSVMCLLGNVTFLMPEGADVRPSAVSLLASTGFDVPDSDASSALPTIVMETTTLFGRCQVRVVEEEESTSEAEEVEETREPSSTPVLEVVTTEPEPEATVSDDEEVAEPEQPEETDDDDFLVG